MHAPRTPFTHITRDSCPPRARRPWSHARATLTALAAAVTIALPLAVAARAQSASAADPATSKQAAARTGTHRSSPALAERQTKAGAAGSAKGQVRTLDLPFEKIAYQKSDLPGYQLTVQQCSTCHSPEYVVYQPRSSSRAYWQATVDKMVKTFGAPLPAEQVAPIVDYLTKTYGAEAPRESK